MEKPENEVQEMPAWESKLYAGMHFAFIACGHPGVYIAFLFILDWSGLIQFRKANPFLLMASYVAYAYVVYFIWRRGAALMMSVFKNFEGKIFLNNSKTKPYMFLCVFVFYVLHIWIVSHAKELSEILMIFLFMRFKNMLLMFVTGIPIIILFVCTAILFICDVYYSFDKNHSLWAYIKIILKICAFNPKIVRFLDGGVVPK